MVEFIDKFNNKVSMTIEEYKQYTLSNDNKKTEKERNVIFEKTENPKCPACGCKVRFRRKDQEWYCTSCSWQGKNWKKNVTNVTNVTKKYDKPTVLKLKKYSRWSVEEENLLKEAIEKKNKYKISTKLILDMIQQNLPHRTRKGICTHAREMGFNFGGKHKKNRENKKNYPKLERGTRWTEYEKKLAKKIAQEGLSRQITIDKIREEMPYRTPEAISSMLYQFGFKWNKPSEDHVVFQPEEENKREHSWI